MSSQHRITVAKGDGIGPEITSAVMDILQAANVPLEYDQIDIGESVYLRGVSSGIPQDAWDVIRRNKVLLKGPITTPQGGGYKSVNVTLRKTLNLFANVRHCKSYAPFVASAHPGMNLIVIRENEEDLYAGIEHQQTQEVVQTLKLVSRPGCERIVRYAFEYARAYGRKKVTCMTKDNIMKHTDGLFHKVFDEIGENYPEVEKEHHIIDIGTARLATQPENYDVIVTLNLYGDILSDVAAQVSGSVGLAGSTNIGSKAAMFEAVHGSAPDIAGKGVANPSGLLLAAVQLLVHVGLPEHATKIKNAWLRTIEDGIHTMDLYREGSRQRLVGTQAFAESVIERLGQMPDHLEPVTYQGEGLTIPETKHTPVKKELVGIDVFLDWSEPGRNPDTLGHQLEGVTPSELVLKMITNRGVKVFPEGLPETACTDHWRCRFVSQRGAVEFSTLLNLQRQISEAGLDVIKTENLYTFAGERGYSLGQGE
ncbi:MAG: NADP-dependent isocitrate dehydrogenase [Gemmataceae bacterium]